jgi:hypothetical protein
VNTLSLPDALQISSSVPPKSAVFIATRGGFALSSLANSNPPSQSANSNPPKSAVFADSPSAEADSTGKRRIVELIAGMSGAAATMAAVMGLAVRIRWRLLRDRHSRNAGERGALSEDPETLIDTSEPLLGSLLGTGDGLTLIGDHGGSRVRTGGARASANRQWELSDE